jgi:hypothetical protein
MVDSTLAGVSELLACPVDMFRFAGPSVRISIRPFGYEFGCSQCSLGKISYQGELESVLPILEINTSSFRVTYGTLHC